MSKGGNLIIPAFAVERTRIYYTICTILVLKGKLDPEIEIYIDSPGHCRYSDFQKHVDLYDDDARKILEDDKVTP